MSEEVLTNCTNAGPISVYVKDGKIVRIRPLPFDWKYDPKTFNPWTMEARGKIFEPSIKSLIPAFSLGYKKRVYSPNRVLYPLKRVDWDPNGKRNTENRGQSKYVRISWDEALGEITEKLKKVIEDDPRKILLQTTTVRAPASPRWRGLMGGIFGTPNATAGGGGIACGNGVHFVAGLWYGSWDAIVDYKHCNYAIYWGVHNGHATGHAAMVSARLVAEAMERGMKLVVFDPTFFCFIFLLGVSRALR